MNSYEAAPYYYPVSIDVNNTGVLFPNKFNLIQFVQTLSSTFIQSNPQYISFTYPPKVVNSNQNYAYSSEMQWRHLKYIVVFVIQIEFGPSVIKLRLVSPAFLGPPDSTGQYSVK